MEQQKMSDVTAKYLNDWTKWCEEIFGKKAPVMPTPAKEAIVKYGPYVTILILIITAPALLTLLGIGAFMAPLAALGGYHWGVLSIIPLAVLVATMALEVLAIPGLMRRSISGWNLWHWSVMINAVYLLISGNPVGMIISAGLGLWVLFQVKEYYK